MLKIIWQKAGGVNNTFVNSTDGTDVIKIQALTDCTIQLINNTYDGKALDNTKVNIESIANYVVETFNQKKK